MDLTELYGPVIHTYTRAQAIADGALIDVTPTAQEAGFTHAVALTAGAWADAVAWTRDNDEYQDESGRLWDVLTMARITIRGVATPDTDRVEFRVLRIPNTPRATRPRLTSLVIHLGPGDDGEPVLTVMTPTED